MRVVSGALTLVLPDSEPVSRHLIFDSFYGGSQQQQKGKADGAGAGGSVEHSKSEMGFHQLHLYWFQTGSGVSDKEGGHWGGDFTLSWKPSSSLQLVAL